MSARAKLSSAFWVLILAVGVGIASGYAAIGFYYAIDLTTILFFSADEKSLASGARQLAWWHIILAPVLAGLIVGQLLRLMEEKRPRGVPHVMEAVQLTGEPLSLRKGLISALITIISLGGGASAGREGPVVHLGATLASFLSRYLKLSWEDARTLVGCGAAAAVAASFNAPLAGVFFALEVIIGHYALRAFAPTVLAAVAGTLVARTHIGDLPLFTVADYSIHSYGEFPLFLILGFGSALLAIAFMKSMAMAEGLRDRFAALPFWLHPILGGLVVGCLGILSPEILGVGYETTLNAINGGYGLMILLPMLALKFTAVVISLASRFGGGIFSPSLVLGALFGGAFGLIVASVSPSDASSEGLYAVIGMGAVTSAVLGAPISTILIVFELTGDYSVAIAVMVACAASNVTISVFSPGSFFHQQLRARGIYLEQGRDTHLLNSEIIQSYVSPDFITLSDAMTIGQARDLMLEKPTTSAVLTDASGHYLGVLSLADMSALSTKDDSRSVQALIATDVQPVPGEMVVGAAMAIFDTADRTILPVIRSAKDPYILGVVAKIDLIEAHNKALKIALGRG